MKSAWIVVTKLKSAMQGNTLHVQEKLYKKEHFPLPNLGRKLESIRNEVVWGRGFFLLR